MCSKYMTKINKTKILECMHVPDYLHCAAQYIPSSSAVLNPFIKKKDKQLADTQCLVMVLIG